MEDLVQQAMSRLGGDVMEYERRDYDSLAVAIPMAVGSFLDRDPTDLEPLIEVIDVEALDLLFRDDGEADVRAQFNYESCAVLVTAESIRVKET